MSVELIDKCSSSSEMVEEQEEEEVEEDEEADEIECVKRGGVIVIPSSKVIPFCILANIVRMEDGSCWGGREG
jgi:hypothetical protein